MADTNDARYALSVALQLALAEAFTYTVIDPYLPQAFPQASSLATSMVFGTYSIAQLLATVVLLLLQILPGIAALQPHHDAVVSSLAFLGFTVAEIITVLLPHSLEAVFVQRVLLGVFAAGY